MADVFVSYKRDDRGVAADIVQALEAAGYTVWWDQRLTPVESWDSTIEHEIEAAKAVLVLWTQKATASSWIRNEADYAKENNKLVPAQIEACKLPLAFRLTQTADLTTWDGRPDHPEWRKTLSWIEKLAGPPQFAVARQLAEQQAREAQHAAEVAERDELRRQNARLKKELEAAQQTLTALERGRTSRGSGETQPPPVPSKPEIKAHRPAAPLNESIVGSRQNAPGTEKPPAGPQANSSDALKKNAARSEKQLLELRRVAPGFTILDALTFSVGLAAILPSAANLVRSASPSLANRLIHGPVAETVQRWVGSLGSGTGWFELSLMEVGLNGLIFIGAYVLMSTLVSDTHKEGELVLSYLLALVIAILITCVSIGLAWVLPTTIFAFLTAGVLLLSLLVVVFGFAQEKSARLRVQAQAVGMALALALLYGASFAV